MKLVEKMGSNFGADNKEIWSEKTILNDIDDYLANNRNINERDEFGRTPLMLTDSPKIINKLIENGANTEAIDYQNHSVFYHAKANGFTNLINALVNNLSKQRG